MSFEVHRDVDIQAPKAVVWEVLTDFAKYPEWNEFVVGCESSLKPGEPIDLHVQLGRKPQLQREWVTACAPGESFSYRMKPVPLGALSSARSHHLEARGDEHTVYRSRFELKGWLAPLVKALLGKKLEAGLGQMNEGIRLRAEHLARERQAQ